MEQRVSLITLGVADIARARTFYESLGWTTRAEPGAEIVFFQAGGAIVALWDRAKLASDSGVRDGGDWGGITLAHCVAGPAEVDALMNDAVAAGAVVTRPAEKTFWGGYSGIFTDPDGHAWEVAHNPHWTLHDDGTVELGE